MKRKPSPRYVLTRAARATTYTIMRRSETTELPVYYRHATYYDESIALGALEELLNG